MDSKLENDVLLSRAIIWWEFKFKLSNLDKEYDDTLDMFDHVTNYRIAMLKGTTNDIIWRAFSVMLEKEARSRYNSLSLLPTIAQEFTW